MKTFQQIALVTLLIVVTPMWGQSQTKTDKVLKFLNATGVEGTVDENGDIQFDFEDHHYFITFDSEDDNYIHMYVQDYWPLDYEEEYELAYYACHVASKDAYGAKAYVKDEHIWVSCEVYIENLDDYEELIQLNMNNINNALQIVYKEM